jgi:hypothetical protein
MLIQTHKLLRVYWNGRNAFVASSWGEDDINSLPISIYREDMVPFSEFEKHISNKITDNDIIYFTKTSKIPRFKYKEFIENSKLNVSKTNRIEYATTLITNLSNIKDNFYEAKPQLPKHCIIPFEDIKQHCDKKFINYVGDVLVDITEYGVSFPLTQYQLSKYKTVYPIVVKQKGHGADKNNDILNTFIFLCNILQTHKIIFDETLNENINEGVVIDDEMYTNIVNMLSSKDKENVSLAMELISNSDFKQSKLYITLILNEFIDKFKKVEQTPNFLNCLGYFKQHLYFVKWDEMVKMLLNNNNPPEDELKIKNYIIRRLNESLENKFKINDINISIR